MMRARSLASLVNATPGLPSPPHGAEVTLHFDVARQPPTAGGGGGSAAAAAAEGAAAAPLPAGRLLVRRRVSRTGRSDCAVRWLAPAAAAPEAAGEAGLQQGQAWQATTPAGLRELLAPLGIQTEAVDRWGCGEGVLAGCRESGSVTPAGCGPKHSRTLSRLKNSTLERCPRLPRRFVVTQHRQAVQVAEPAQLARFLELLVGTAGMEEALRALGEEAAVAAEQYDVVEEGMVG